MLQTTPTLVKDIHEERVLKHIVEALRSIRYGAVEIVIQDGKVLQIETREKRRFDSSATNK